MAKVFIDTNVLVYTIDTSDQVKHERAISFLRSIEASQEVAVSTQVLNELYSAATRKVGLSPADAFRVVDRAAQFEVVLIRTQMVLSAIQRCMIQQISYWDSLVLESARAGKCSVLYTEDYQHRAVIDGVRIVNPFLA